MSYLNYDYCFIGNVCQSLDNSKVKYHHCNTWFRLFLEDGDYAITTVKNNNVNEVVVSKGLSIKAPIVFRGTLQDFENWLKNSR